VLHGWHGVVAQAQVIHQCAEPVPLEQTDTAAHQESEAVGNVNKRAWEQVEFERSAPASRAISAKNLMESRSGGP
jgi:hypothetical protein